MGVVINEAKAKSKTHGLSYYSVVMIMMVLKIHILLTRVAQ